MLTVIGIDVDGARAFDDHAHFETLSNPFQGRLPDAIIEREAANPETPHFPAFQLFVQAGAAECGVAVRIEFVSFAEDFEIWREMQRFMKRRSWRSLHAMRRPWTTAFFETDVTGGMPVAREEDGNVVAARLVNPAI